MSKFPMVAFTLLLDTDIIKPQKAPSAFLKAKNFDDLENEFQEWTVDLCLDPDLLQSKNPLRLQSTGDSSNEENDKKEIVCQGIQSHELPPVLLSVQEIREMARGYAERTTDLNYHPDLSDNDTKQSDQPWVSPKYVYEMAEDYAMRTADFNYDPDLSENDTKQSDQSWVSVEYVCDQEESSTTAKRFLPHIFELLPRKQIKTENPRESLPENRKDNLIQNPPPGESQNQNNPGNQISDEDECESQDSEKIQNGREEGRNNSSPENLVAANNSYGSSDIPTVCRGLREAIQKDTPLREEVKTMVLERWCPDITIQDLEVLLDKLFIRRSKASMKYLSRVIGDTGFEEKKKESVTSRKKKKKESLTPEEEEKKESLTPEEKEKVEKKKKVLWSAFEIFLDPKKTYFSNWVDNIYDPGQKTAKGVPKKGKNTSDVQRSNQEKRNRMKENQLQIREAILNSSQRKQYKQRKSGPK